MLEILVFGDSHTSVFVHANKRQKLINFDVLTVGGATAYGLCNYNSKTGAVIKFIEKMITSNKKYDKLILMFGEVDCRNLVWNRSERENITPDEQIKLSIINLFKFIKNTALLYFNKKNVIILGSILAIMAHDHVHNKLYGARYNITVEYNRKLKLCTGAQKINYIDIADEMAKNIDKYKTTYNPHLRYADAYDLWFPKCAKLLKL